MEGVQNRGLIGTGEGGVNEGRVSPIKFSTFWSLQLLILQNFAWPNLIFVARQNNKPIHSQTYNADKNSRICIVIGPTVDLQ